MQLVDEENDLTVGFLYLVQNCLQPLLKFAPVLGTCHQGTHIERKDGFIHQRFGDVLFHDPLGQALGNGSLANTRFADQNRVVFGLPGENADHIPDLLVTTDHRVLLLLSCPLHQIRAVFFQGFVGTFRGISGDPLVTPDGLQGLQGILLRDTVGVKQILDTCSGGIQQSQEQMLHGHKFILHLGSLGFGGSKDRIRIRSDIETVHIPASGNGGNLPKQLGRCRLHAFHGFFHLPKQLGSQSALLPQQRQQQMDLLQLLMTVLDRKILCRLHSFQRLLGIVVEIHSNPSFRFSTLALRVLICLSL